MPIESPAPTPDPAPLRLALRPKEAAASLGIGVRLLWEKTNSREIPCARIGRAVVYPISLLEKYLEEQADQWQGGGR